MQMNTRVPILKDLSSNWTAMEILRGIVKQAFIVRHIWEEEIEILSVSVSLSSTVVYQGASLALQSDEDSK